MKRTTGALLLFLLFVIQAACAADTTTPLPRSGFTKAQPVYTIHYQCENRAGSCVHNGGIEWFQLGKHDGNVYVEVYGGAQVTGVFNGAFQRLDVEIENQLGFFYEGSRYAYITGIPTKYKEVLIKISLPGYGHADFGAK